MSDAPVQVMLTANEWLAIVATSLTAAVALSALLAVVYKRILLPNLVLDLKQTITPDLHATRDAAQEAVRQLTVNGHSSEKNTAKDDFTEVKVGLKSLTDDMTVLLHRMERVETLQIENRAELVQHLRWSNQIVPELREEIERKQDKTG